MAKKILNYFANVSIYAYISFIEHWYVRLIKEASMTKTFASRLAVISAVAILCSCGDSSTGAKDDGDKSSKESVKNASSLGKCTADRAGEVIYVEDEKSEYICVSNEWKNTGATENSEGDESDTSSSPSKNKSSSSTKGNSGNSSDSDKGSSGSGPASSSSVVKEPTSSAPGASETIPTKPVIPVNAILIAIYRVFR